MLDKALSGNRQYWVWMSVLAALAFAGFIAYLRQLSVGLGVTGLGRDVSWGLYIGQFTFLVGIAASGVMLVLPYYLHNHKAFGKITILGEFLAISAVTMSILFIFVDMGQPMRVMYVLLHPALNSMMFWDSLVLTGYLVLNVVVGWTVLGAERKHLPPPKWVKPLIILTIIWAPSIHTVTAFLFAGLPGRYLWLTAIMAARFLASAFAAGPALLILLCLLLRRVSSFDAGTEAIQSMGKIVTYFMITNVFFLLLEVFTAFYSNIPGHMHPYEYLYAGSGGPLVTMMWSSAALAVLALVLLVNPSFRRNERMLGVAAAAVFISLWIDKGFGLIIGGFVPNPMEKVVDYWPTWTETMITVGVWAVGLLLLTVLFKVAVTVKEEAA